ncbi:HAD family hydrolase [Candidatus Protochlamydia phocaeensis]|uniref:HAD family hydrolase n=1 Tax=Candidatus Protochlamydia phocaeensis TaxID=1414722 RepID=UPI000837E224|nr:HAD family phosphatase [Candidatus Protochlamydia phocaeensis]
MSVNIKALFLDIGGVLLTNGWDHRMREKAAHIFDLDFLEMNTRHALTFDTYEIGKLSLDEYLKRVVFYEPRSFSLENFKDFMFSQSQPLGTMLELMKNIKKEHGLKVVGISNEGRELMLNRIEKFKLKELFDMFVCSCFVHLRKPDLEIYHMALDLAQVKPGQIIYIDDRSMLVEIGQQLGMQAFQHINEDRTKQTLEDLLKVTMTKG